MANPLPTVDLEETGYLRNGSRALDRRFLHAMSFHRPEGLAAVLDESGAYHIDAKGQPRYSQRYREAFGFYCGAATVRDENGYFHIDPDGNALHTERFRWAGNFQEGLCPVQDEGGFFHARRDGTQAYQARYAYAGDFRHGVAVVHGTDGAFHIRPDGLRLHSRTFSGVGVFHKGFAVAEDDRGAFHIGKNGKPAHRHRFHSAEPFYNGVALCKTHDGRFVRLRESGYYSYLPSVAPPIPIAQTLRDLEGGHRVGLFVRHAKRHTITSGWGNEVPLTEEGVAQARRLGEVFRSATSVKVYASPIHRCIQTGHAFATGVGQPQDPAVTTLLGDPGPFTDPERSDELKIEPGEFAAFATKYVEGGRAAGMLPMEKACESIVRRLRVKLSEGLTLFVTHDFFAAGLLRFLGLKHPTREDWAENLEGVCFVLRPDGGLEWHRFLGLEAIRQC